MSSRFFWWMFFLLDAALIFFFLAGYVSAFLPPEYFWWTGLPATVLPYLALLLLGVGLIGIVRRRWLLVGLHIVLALLMVPRLQMIPDSPMYEPSNSAGPNLTVMTFNVPPPPENEPAQESIRASMHNLVTAEDPHLVALQGAVVVNGRFPGGARTSWHVDTLEAAGYTPLPPGHALHPNDLTHQSVFSRIDLEEQAFFRLADDAPIERRATRAVFEWDNESAVLYNVHLRSFDRSHLYQFIQEGRYLRAARNFIGMYRRSIVQRAEEARLLREVIDEEEEPVIVVGDFNSTPYNWEYRHIRHGLIDAYLAAGEGWGATWHSRLPFVRIDHVLVSPDWHVSSSRVLSSNLSDHLPVVVTLHKNTGD